MNGFVRIRIRDFFSRLIGYLISLLIFLGLVLVVKWRIDKLYIDTYEGVETNFGIVEEVKKTYGQLHTLVTGEKKEEVVPVEVPESIEVGKEVEITIFENEDLSSIGQKLVAANLVENNLYFEQLVEDMGLRNSFAVGTYQLETGMKVREIVCKLTGTEQRKYVLEFSTPVDPRTVGEALKDKGVILDVEKFVSQVNEMGYGNGVLQGVYEVITPLKVAKIIEELYGAN